MKNRILWVLIFVAIGVCFYGAERAFADNVQVDLPYGIGSIQLPWQATEIVTGLMKPIKGGGAEWITGASLPIVTLGRLSDGYRIIDGSIGGIFAVPNSGATPDAYGGLGHDLIQDIPGLKQFSSAHLNVGTSYSNAAHGWLWGGTVSYAFWASPTVTLPQPTVTTAVQTPVPTAPPPPPSTTIPAPEPVP
jgi:hypothetical protein